jgi:hypothetical protein
MMALENSLWTIQFETAGEWRTGGVVIFDNGRVFGGDSNYYYFGTFTEHNNVISGEARVVHFSGALSTGFGNSPDFAIVIEARVAGDVINGAIHKPGNNTARLPLRCVRRQTL